MAMTIADAPDLVTPGDMGGEHGGRPVHARHIYLYRDS